MLPGGPPASSALIAAKPRRPDCSALSPRDAEEPVLPKDTVARLEVKLEECEEGQASGAVLGLRRALDGVDGRTVRRRRGSCCVARRSTLQSAEGGEP